MSEGVEVVEGSVALCGGPYTAVALSAHAQGFHRPCKPWGLKQWFRILLSPWRLPGSFIRGYLMQVASNSLKDDGKGSKSRQARVAGKWPALYAATVDLLRSGLKNGPRIRSLYGRLCNLVAPFELLANSFGPPGIARWHGMLNMPKDLVQAAKEIGASQLGESSMGKSFKDALEVEITWPAAITADLVRVQKKRDRRWLSFASWFRCFTRQDGRLQGGQSPINIETAAITDWLGSAADGKKLLDELRKLGKAPTKAETPVMMFVHGGACWGMSIRTHRGLGDFLVEARHETAMVVVSFEYDKSHKASMGEAFNQVTLAYLWMTQRAEVPSSVLSASADSFGATMLLSSLYQTAKTAKSPPTPHPLSSLVLVSPWVDTAAPVSTFVQYPEQTQDCFTPDMLVGTLKNFTLPPKCASWEHPALNPSRVELKELADILPGRVMITWGEFEMFRPQARAFANGLKTLRGEGKAVTVETVVVRNQVHSSPCVTQMHGNAEAVDRIRKFVLAP